MDQPVIVQYLVTIVLLLTGVVCSLIGAHYISMIGDTKANKNEISLLKVQITAAILDAAEKAGAVALKAAEAAHVAALAAQTAASMAATALEKIRANTLTINKDK
jgi:hypothetical protein